MAEKLDPKQVVTFEELLRSMMYEQEATRRVLVRKGLLSNKEVFGEGIQCRSPCWKDKGIWPLRVRSYPIIRGEPIFRISFLGPQAPFEKKNHKRTHPEQRDKDQQPGDRETQRLFAGGRAHQQQQPHQPQHGHKHQ